MQKLFHKHVALELEVTLISDASLAEPHTLPLSCITLTAQTTE